MLVSVLVYQCAAAGAGYAMAWAVWWWAFVEGEVSSLDEKMPVLCEWEGERVLICMGM